LPGEDSVKKGYLEAVEKGLKNIHLMTGTHIVTDNNYNDLPYVVFAQPMTVSGDGREKTFVKGGGFKIIGRILCTFIDLTIHKTKEDGLYGDCGMIFDCRRVKFDNCGAYGVRAVFTIGRLTNCQVTNCTMSGILSSSDSTIEIEGEESRINNNCTNGESFYYGLDAHNSSSIIHLLSPLKKEDVTTNNNSGGTYDSEYSQIETVNSF